MPYKDKEKQRQAMIIINRRYRRKHGHQTAMVRKITKLGTIDFSPHGAPKDLEKDIKLAWRVIRSRARKGKRVALVQNEGELYESSEYAQSELF